MKYYPVYLNLKGKTVLLIGGGDVARQKIGALLESEARVRLVAPEVSPPVQELIRQHHLSWQQRGYATGDLDGAALVIAATDDASLQKRIAEEARARGIWVNIVDVTALCDFIAPAVISQGDLQIAISTGGASPALAKLLRQKLEMLIGPEYGMLIKILQRYRPEILKLPKPERDAFWNHVVNPIFIDQIKEHGAGPAERRIKELIHGKSAV